MVLFHSVGWHLIYWTFSIIIKLFKRKTERVFFWFWSNTKFSPLGKFSNRILRIKTLIFLQVEYTCRWNFLIVYNNTGGAVGGAGEQPQASKTGKYIAPSLREGAGNRRGETMPRSQRGINLLRVCNQEQKYLMNSFEFKRYHYYSIVPPSPKTMLNSEQLDRKTWHSRWEG